MLGTPDLVRQICCSRSHSVKDNRSSSNDSSDLKSDSSLEMEQPSKEAPKCRRNRSQPDLKEFQRRLIKDSAREEMSHRRSFEKVNQSLNRSMSSKNALVALPDEKVQILDMWPRVDIIED